MAPVQTGLGFSPDSHGGSPAFINSCVKEHGMKKLNTKALATVIGGGLVIQRPGWHATGGGSFGNRP